MCMLFVCFQLFSDVLSAFVLVYSQIHQFLTFAFSKACLSCKYRTLQKPNNNNSPSCVHVGFHDVFVFQKASLACRQDFERAEQWRVRAQMWLCMCCGALALRRSWGSEGAGKGGGGRRGTGLVEGKRVMGEKEKFF